MRKLTALLAAAFLTAALAVPAQAVAWEQGIGVTAEEKKEDKALTAELGC